MMDEPDHRQANIQRETIACSLQDEWPVCNGRPIFRHRSHQSSRTGFSFGGCQSCYSPFFVLLFFFTSARLSVRTRRTRKVGEIF